MADRFLFRAWLPVMKQMVYPTAVRTVSKGLAIEYENEKGERCLDGPGWFKLMQCTGLKDKNGALIYEGDVVKLWHENEKSETVIEKLEVRSSDCGGYELVNEYCSPVCVSEWTSNIEVIGNKYEKAKLLDGGAE